MFSHRQVLYQSIDPFDANLLNERVRYLRLMGHTHSLTRLTNCLLPVYTMSHLFIKGFFHGSVLDCSNALVDAGTGTLTPARLVRDELSLDYYYLEEVQAQSANTQDQRKNQS